MSELRGRRRLRLAGPAMALLLLTACGLRGAQSTTPERFEDGGVWARIEAVSEEFGNLDTLQIYGTARTRRDLVGEFAVALEPADPRRDTAGVDFDRLPDLQGSADQRAGHNGAEAAHGEDPVDRKARRSGAWGSGAALAERLAKGFAQRIDALACH